MKQFKIREKEYQMPTEWADVTLEIYVRLAELEEKKEGFGIPELYLLKVLECLCNVEDGELDELTLDVVNELVGLIGYIQEEPTWNNGTHLVINDVDYVFPADLNRLTMGEYISIKTLQENSTTAAGIIPYILAIILRPGKKEVDVETGRETWIQDKFDTNNLEWRKELFMKQPVFNLMGPVTFFLNGKGISTTDTKDFIPEV